MLVEEMSDKECRELLARAAIGRLGCSLDDQPYVLPIYFAYEADHVYVLSTLGRKVKWMRTNPKVCIQIDEIKNQCQWESVVVNGRYQELIEPLYATERSRARELLARRHQWWLNAMAERRTTADDLSISALFFRIDIDSMTGLRARPEGESEAAAK
jgi:uncharacterized protein